MPRSSLIRGVGIAAFVTAISAAHHATDPALVWLHVAYQDLCYAPILVAAYWFGVPGGLAVALVAGLGTTLHFQAVWQGNTPFLLAQYGQAIAFKTHSIASQFPRFFKVTLPDLNPGSHRGLR